MASAQTRGAAHPAERRTPASDDYAVRGHLVEDRMLADERAKVGTFLFLVARARWARCILAFPWGSRGGSRREDDAMTTLYDVAPSVTRTSSSCSKVSPIPSYAPEARHRGSKASYAQSARAGLPS